MQIGLAVQKGSTAIITPASFPAWIIVVIVLIIIAIGVLVAAAVITFRKRQRDRNTEYQRRMVEGRSDLSGSMKSVREEQKETLQPYSINRDNTYGLLDTDSNLVDETTHENLSRRKL